MNTVVPTAPAPPPASPAQPRWTPLTVFLGVLAVLGITFVAAVGVSVVNPDLDTETFGLIIQAVFAGALFLVPLALVPWPGRFLAPPSLLGLRRFSPVWLGWTPLIFIGFVIVLAIYGAIVQPDPQQIIEDIQREKETVKIVALGLLVVLAAPISEELFFRGFLFGGLRGKMAFWPAALLSGAIFGLIHAPGGAAQVPPLMFFGVVLAWVYERSGSLWPAVLLHLLLNAFSFSFTVFG